MPDGFHYKNDRLKETRDVKLELGGAKDHFAPPSGANGQVGTVLKLATNK